MLSRCSTVAAGVMGRAAMDAFGAGWSLPSCCPTSSGKSLGGSRCRGHPRRPWRSGCPAGSAGPAGRQWLWQVDVGEGFAWRRVVGSAGRRGRPTRGGQGIDGCSPLPDDRPAQCPGSVEVRFVGGPRNAPTKNRPRATACWRSLAARRAAAGRLFRPGAGSVPRSACRGRRSLPGSALGDQGRRPAGLGRYRRQGGLQTGVRVLWREAGKLWSSGSWSSSGPTL